MILGGYDEDNIVNRTYAVRDTQNFDQLDDLTRRDGQYDGCLAIINEEIMLLFGGTSERVVFMYNDEL